MTKIKPSDIELGFEGRAIGLAKRKYIDEEDFHKRISELLNILEEPIDFKIPFIVEFEGNKIVSLKKGVNSVYIKGFKDGEEAQKKKTREVFTEK